MGKMIRTSIQILPESLAALARRWPELTPSAALRLALDRHEYLMNERPLSRIVTEHMDVIAAATDGLDTLAFRVAVRALESAVRGYLLENSLTHEPWTLELIKQIGGADPRERLQILDAASAWRRGA